MNSENPFGRIISANSRECVVAYRTSEQEIPRFGSMVRIPVQGAQDFEIYGLVTDIQIEEDGFLRQLATADTLPAEVLADNRVNRNVPIVLRILFLGCRDENGDSHLLPPTPPLTLTAIFRCNSSEIARFTAHGNFGYFRHILNAVNAPAAELFAVHIRLTSIAQNAKHNEGWTRAAVEELITLLQDDYAGLTAILGALGDADISF